MSEVLELIREIYANILRLIDIALSTETPQDPADRIGRPPLNKRQMELSKIWDSAYEEFGVAEVPGYGNNPRILEYFKVVEGNHKHDSIEWCAAGLNFALNQVGYVGTGSAVARKFNGWGVKIDEPEKGCVAVLWRESRNSWKGHVTLFQEWLDEEKKEFWGLGFNQSDEVKISIFRAERVLSFRSPF